jgi:hypothetical protein
MAPTISDSFYVSNNFTRDDEERKEVGESQLLDKPRSGSRSGKNGDKRKSSFSKVKKQSPVRS